MMKIKSYFASTIAAAMQEARQEMGPEAMILQSRKTPAENRHLGEYEVVLALVADGSPAAEAAGGAGAPGTPRGRLSGELAALRRELEMMHRAISRSVLTVPRWSISSAALSEAFARLLAAEVDGELARDILDGLGQKFAGPGATGLESALEEELARRLLVNPGLGKRGSPRVAALVGPPGSGKTTTLVKLAVTQGLASRKPVQLLSMDNFRVGGADHLRSYAAILGVGFQALETVGALGSAIEEHRSKDLILIDTPGYSGREMENGADLARFLAARPEIDVHLVLTASMKAADLSRVAEHFSIFRPDNLLFTRLDETGSLGTLYSLAVRTGLPVSFLGTGQQIPEDLDPASGEQIAGALLGRGRRASVAA